MLIRIHIIVHVYELKIKKIQILALRRLIRAQGFIIALLLVETKIEMVNKTYLSV